MNLGTQLAGIAAWIIESPDFGQEVTITPSPARAAAGVRPFTVAALIEAPSPDTVQQMRLEGARNVQNADPHNFTFPGNAGVQEGDFATWDGVTYELFNAPQQPAGGVKVVTMCVGLRYLVPGISTEPY